MFNEIWEVLHRTYRALRTKEAVIMLSVFLLLTIWGPEGAGS